MNLKLLIRCARSGAAMLILLSLAACGSQTPTAVAPQPAVQNSPTSQLTLELPSATPTQEAPVSIQTSAATAAAQPAEVQPIETPVANPSICKNPAALTPALTEGPYFKTGSPERASLIDSNTQGMILTLTGFVLTADCQPVAHALLDFWQANAQGQYDNASYTLRGHQYTDENGRYQLVTVVPGLYPGRTEHIHVKVQAPNGPILTTQLFFPGVASNQSDSIYNSALLINVLGTDAKSTQASYDFVIKLK